MTRAPKNTYSSTKRPNVRRTGTPATEAAIAIAPTTCHHRSARSTFDLLACMYSNIASPSTNHVANRYESVSNPSLFAPSANGTQSAYCAASCAKDSRSARHERCSGKCFTNALTSCIEPVRRMAAAAPDQPAGGVTSWTPTVDDTTTSARGDDVVWARARECADM